MVYYFKETHKLHLLTDFQMPVRDEGGMRNNWVARFWNIAYFYQNENGDLIHHHTYLFLFRNKKEAIKSILDTKITGLVKLLVCHSIDRWHFHWLDFYEVVDLGDGKYKTRKLKKAHARFKGEQLFNDKKEIIPLNFEKFKKAEWSEDKANVACADNYGQINRFRIIQKDRLDIFHHTIEYFGIKDGFAKSPELEYKKDRYYKLLTELYKEVFLKSDDKFDETGGCIILDAYNSGFVYKYFPKEDFQKVKNILLKYIEPDYVPVFLSDGAVTKKEDWWKPLSFMSDKKEEE